MFRSCGNPVALVMALFCLQPNYFTQSWVGTFSELPHCDVRVFKAHEKRSQVLLAVPAIHESSSLNSIYRLLGRSSRFVYRLIPCQPFTHYVIRLWLFICLALGTRWPGVTHLGWHPMQDLMGPVLFGAHRLGHVLGINSFFNADPPTGVHAASYWG